MFALPRKRLIPIWLIASSLAIVLLNSFCNKMGMFPNISLSSCPRSDHAGKLLDFSSASIGVTPYTNIFIGNVVRCTLNLQWGDETPQLFAPDPPMSEHYLLKPNFWKDVCHELPVHKPEAMRHSRCLAHTRNCIDNPTYWMLEEGIDAAARTVFHSVEDETFPITNNYCCLLDVYHSMNLPRLLLVHDKIGNYCVPKLDPNLHMLSHNFGKDVCSEKPNRKLSAY